jgi:cytochrome b561
MVAEGGIQPCVFNALMINKETAMNNQTQTAIDRYPVSLRILHWVRAVVIAGLLWAGWHMTGLDDEVVSKFTLYYPWHKSFGVLAFLLVLVQIALRVRTPVLPQPPLTLAAHERFLSRFVQRSMYVLIVAVPLMGYSMSSTFTMSDGVFFFGVNLPELLPKNDNWFVVFQWLHKVLAYTLLVLIVLHIAGALKHRLFDRDPRNDVLRRML